MQSGVFDLSINRLSGYNCFQLQSKYRDIYCRDFSYVFTIGWHREQRKSNYTMNNCQRQVEFEARDVKPGRVSLMLLLKETGSQAITVSEKQKVEIVEEQSLVYTYGSKERKRKKKLSKNEETGQQKKFISYL